MKKIIATSRAYVLPQLKEHEKSELRKALNIEYIGKSNCNDLDANGNVVAVDHPNVGALSQVHQRISACNYQVMLEFDLFDDGSIGNWRTINVS